MHSFFRLKHKICLNRTGNVALKYLLSMCKVQGVIPALQKNWVNITWVHLTCLSEKIKMECFSKRHKNFMFKALPSKSVLQSMWSLFHFSIPIITWDVHSTFIWVPRFYFFCKYISWAKYFDGRKPVDKHVLKLSHLGETLINTVFCH
jgi:hypothetical protein